MKLDDIQVADLSYKTVSGECTFSGELKKVEGRFVSGEVELNLKTRSPNINLESISGDVEVLSASAPSTGIEFHTKSGSIRREKAVGLETEANSKQTLLFSQRVLIALTTFLLG